MEITKRINSTNKKKFNPSSTLFIDNYIGFGLVIFFTFEGSIYVNVRIDRLIDRLILLFFFFFYFLFLFYTWSGTASRNRISSLLQNSHTISIISRFIRMQRLKNLQSATWIKSANKQIQDISWKRHRSRKAATLLYARVSLISLHSLASRCMQSSEPEIVTGIHKTWISIQAASLVVSRRSIDTGPRYWPRIFARWFRLSPIIIDDFMPNTNTVR